MPYNKSDVATVIGEVTGHPFLIGEDVTIVRVDRDSYKCIGNKTAFCAFCIEEELQQKLTE